MELKILKIKSTNPASQGEFVIINEEDFDASKHELYGAVSKPVEVVKAEAPVVEQPVADQPVAEAEAPKRHLGRPPKSVDVI